MKRSILLFAFALGAFALFQCSDPKVEPGINGNDNAIVPMGDGMSVASHLDSMVAYTYEALSNGTVRLTFQNTTGHTMNGDLIREGLTFLQNGAIITEFSVPSGDTYTYIDDNVLPGETYRYIFEHWYGSDYQIHFDTVTAVSDIPALGNFILIAPSVDDEYEVLTDGYTVVIGGTNIRVEANFDKTKSVVFYLNGKKYKDKSAPFALYGDDSGDYRRGKLKNGTYTLSAVAFPDRNAKGLAGDTATVNFTVNNTYQDGE